MTPAENSCHTRIRLLGSLPSCSPSLSLYLSSCPHLSISVCSSVCLGLTACHIFCSTTISQHNLSQNLVGLMGTSLFLIDSGLVDVWKELLSWPFPSAVILAVAEGYDTFNIVFMAIGDSQASECFSVSPTHWLTASVQKHSAKNSPFIVGLLICGYIISSSICKLLLRNLKEKKSQKCYLIMYLSIFNYCNTQG